MSYSSKDLEIPKKGIYIYPFKLSLSLIHHFRSFQQENHNFMPNFLETATFLIADFKKRNPDFIKISDYLSSNEPSHICVDLIIIAIHYYFGSIANMEIFLALLKVSFAFPSLSKSHVNKTNIMTPLTVKEVLKFYSSLKSCEKVMNIFIDFYFKFKDGGS